MTDEITAYLLYCHVFRALIDYQNGADPPDFDSGLRTKREGSPDTKHWTFYLRRGVRWSDGAPFTADDVLFTYDVIRDEKVDSVRRDTFKEGKDSKGAPIYPDLVKLDDHTVRFDLHNPTGSSIDEVYNLWLIPKHKWESAWLAGSFAEVMKISDSLTT